MPAVNKDYLPLNHFRCRAREEFDQADVIVVLHGAAAGILFGSGFENLIGIGAEHGAKRIGIDGAGGDGVDAYAARREFNGEIA